MDDYTKQMREELTTYAKLARHVGDMILMNNITDLDEFYYENMHNGEMFYCSEFMHEDGKTCDDDYESCDAEGINEVYQWYAITQNGADFLTRETEELVYYNEQLDTFFWGICHWGTAWSHVRFDNWK